jgi:hypothetical protein
MLGSEPTNRNNVPYHITNYPIFGVAFGLISGERDTPTDYSIHPVVDDYTDGRQYRFPSYRFRIAGRLLPFDHFIHMDNVTDGEYRLFR